MRLIFKEVGDLDRGDLVGDGRGADRVLGRVPATTLKSPRSRPREMRAPSSSMPAEWINNPEVGSFYSISRRYTQSAHVLA